MLSSLRLGLLVCGAALAAAGGGVAACFSDRAAATSPNVTTGDCRIAVGSPIVGSTQALVAIRNYTFVPDTLRIKRGAVVTWINCEPETVDAHSSKADGGEWTSGFLTPGKSWSTTLSSAGPFSYFCEPHPFMKGVVIVE